MDKILMRHDDVNTFGVILYVDPNDGTKIYKDRELSRPITYDEFKDVLLKVAYVGFPTIGGGSTDIYEKPVQVFINEEMAGFVMSSDKSFGVQNENAPQNQPK